MPWFCSHRLFMSPVIYCGTNIQEHGIYLPNEICQWYQNWSIVVTHNIFLWKLVSISNKILYFSQKLLIIDFVSWACSELTFWLHLQHNKNCFKAYKLLLLSTAILREMRYVVDYPCSSFSSKWYYYVPIKNLVMIMIMIIL